MKSASLPPLFVRKVVKLCGLQGIVKWYILTLKFIVSIFCVTSNEVRVFLINILLSY